MVEIKAKKEMNEPDFAIVQSVVPIDAYLHRLDT